MNSATGTIYTLQKGTICHAHFKDGGKVDAAACARLCNKEPGCTEFSVGGVIAADKEQPGCRYANRGGGCCLLAQSKYGGDVRRSYKDNGSWKREYCTPFSLWGDGHGCSSGTCKLYTKKAITTKAGDVQITGLFVEPWVLPIMVLGSFSEKNVMGSMENEFPKCHGLHGTFLGQFPGKRLELN